MAKGFKAEHFDDYSIVKGNVKVKISLKKYGKNTQKAQFWLDGQIMEDVIPYMPMNSGTFIDETRLRSIALQGTGQVCVGAPPMGRFLYGGKVMIGETSKSPWAMAGETKILTDKDLDFFKGAHPEVTAEWVEPALKKHKHEWVAGAEKQLKGE